MEYDHDNVRLAVTEDRLSSLPDELIHQILSRLDIKFAVQTCLLSSRWKPVWKSVPCLKFASWKYDSLPKFAKFVNHVLSHRNHQVEVSSVDLHFTGAATQVFVRKIANYAFSHNVQELTVSGYPKKNHEFPPCLFSSRTLKHLTFSTCFYLPCLTPKTPWDYPALTTLYLSDISLCDDNSRSTNLFSKCVNLKNLTLKRFSVEAEVFDIITPRLSNLMLTNGRRLKAINVIAPQLQNLTIIDCSIEYLNAPPSVSSLFYRGSHPTQLSKDCFCSLNKVTVRLNLYCSNMPYKEKYARETIKMLQELHSVRYLTLNLDIVECLSSFPDLLSHLPSPFSNLICVDIDSSREEPYKVKISTEARNFLLENSPSATFITDLPEEPPTKAMVAKQAREKKRAKLISNIESHMKDLQASLEQENRLFSRRKLAKEKPKAILENLMPELQQLLTREKMISIPGQEKEFIKIVKVVGRMKKQMVACVVDLQDAMKQELDDYIAIDSNRVQVRSWLEALPKRQRAELEARYSRQFEEIQTVCDRLSSSNQEVRTYLTEVLDSIKENVPDSTSTFQDVSSSNPLVSQPTSSSSSASIPTPPLQVSTPCREPTTQDC